MSVITKVFGGFDEIMDEISGNNFYTYYLNDDGIGKEDVYKTFGEPDINLGIEQYWVFRIGSDYFCIDENMNMSGTNASLYRSILDFIFYKAFGIRYNEIKKINITTSEKIINSNTYSQFMDGYDANDLNISFLNGYDITECDIYKTFGKVSNKYFFNVSNEHFYIHIKDMSIELRGTNTYMYGAIIDYILSKSGNELSNDCDDIDCVLPRYVDLVKNEEDHCARIIQRNCYNWIWKADCDDGTNGIYVRLHKDYFETSKEYFENK